MPTSNANFRQTVLDMLGQLVEEFGDGNVLTLKSQKGSDTFNLSPIYYHSISFKLLYRVTAEDRPYFRAYLVTSPGKSHAGKSQAIARIESIYEAARFVTAAEALFAIRAGRHGESKPDDEAED